MLNLNKLKPKDKMFIRDYETKQVILSFIINAQQYIDFKGYTQGTFYDFIEYCRKLGYEYMLHDYIRICNEDDLYKTIQIDIKTYG